MPIGNIVQEIATHGFGECFAYGVKCADNRADRDDYALALEGNMQEFIYSYTKVIDQGFDAEGATCINRTVHATLHDLMLQVVADVRPLLIEECEITDIAGAPPAESARPPRPRS